MLTFRYKDTYSMAEWIKKQWPDIPIIVGGAHASTFREKALESCSAFSLAFVRDAEESLTEFCRGQDVAEIKGLIYRNGTDIVYTGDRTFGYLDDISWPQDYGVSIDKYLSKEILILSSRGCPMVVFFAPFIWPSVNVFAFEVQPVSLMKLNIGIKKVLPNLRCLMTTLRFIKNVPLKSVKKFKSAVLLLLSAVAMAFAPTG